MSWTNLSEISQLVIAESLKIKVTQPGVSIHPRDIQFTSLSLHFEHRTSLNTFHVIYPVLIFSRWDMVGRDEKLSLIDDHKEGEKNKKNSIR